MSLLKLTFLMVFLGFIAACQKEEPQPGRNQNHNPDTPLSTGSDSLPKLTIKVVDTSGNPVSGNKVVAFKNKMCFFFLDIDCFWENDTGKTFLTDANGLLSLDSLSPGKYYFRIPNEQLNNMDMLYESDSVGFHDSVFHTFILRPYYTLKKITLDQGGTKRTVANIKFRNSDFHEFDCYNRKGIRQYSRDPFSQRTFKFSLYLPFYVKVDSSNLPYMIGFDVSETDNYFGYIDHNDQGFVDSIAFLYAGRNTGLWYYSGVSTDQDGNPIQSRYYSNPIWLDSVIIRVDRSFDNQKNPLNLLPEYGKYLACIGPNYGLYPNSSAPSFSGFFRMPLALGKNNVIGKTFSNDSSFVTGNATYNSFGYPTQIIYTFSDKNGVVLDELTYEFFYSH